MNFSGKGMPLSADNMAAALSLLGMQEPNDLSVLWAVLSVESRGFGFSVDRRPKILFERHIFFRECGGRFASQAPDLCAKTGGGYLGGSAEYDRLARALDLCRNAGISDEIALRSASWGLGQVMGFNAIAAGFKGAEDMVQAMADSEGAQLAGMVGFIGSKDLDKSLRARDWTSFARGYNGSTYWQNEYDVKLKAAFEKFESGINRDLRTRTAQGALTYLGYKPGDPDGIVGQNTRNAIAAFRRDASMSAGNELDDAVYEAIMNRAGLE